MFLFVFEYGTVISKELIWNAVIIKNLMKYMIVAI